MGPSSIKEQMLFKYGRFMPPRAIVYELCYPSMSALTSAIKRGKVPFVPMTIEGRPGFYASTEEIASIVERSFERRSMTNPSVDLSATSN